MAKASTDTSWSEAQMLTSKTISDNRRMLDVKSGTSNIAPKVRAIMTWAVKIQGRRRPIGRYPNRSINGPQTHFMAQGQLTMAMTLPTDSVGTPLPIK